MEKGNIRIRRKECTTGCTCTHRRRENDLHGRNYCNKCNRNICQNITTSYWLKHLISVMVFCLTFSSPVQGQDAGTMHAITEGTMDAQLEYYDPKQYNATSKKPEYFWSQTNQQQEEISYEYEILNRDFDAKGQEISFEEVIVEEAVAPPAAGGQSGCPNGMCGATSEESRLLAIEKLKLKILERLNLKDPLNMTIPKISFDTPPMRTLFRKHGFKVDRENPRRVLSDIDEQETVKEKRVISVASPVPEHLGYRGIRFKFSEDELQQEVKSATLWVYILPNPSTDRHMTLRLARYQWNNNGEVELVRFQTKVLNIPPRSKHGSWRHFNIHGTVYSWFNQVETNLGIVISSDEHSHLIADGINENSEHKPMVEVDLVAGIHQRRKRLVCTGRADENETRCCRYSTIINFDAIGWEFVIAPKNFNIHYCSGDCPFIMLKSGFKRMLTQYPLGAGNERMRKGAQGCCSPDKLKPLSLLYFDNNQNVIYSTLPDMIVEECGCL